MNIEIEKKNGVWVYNEEEILKYLKINSINYQSFLDFCNKHNCARTNFEHKFRKENKNFLNSLNWRGRVCVNDKNYQNYDWLYDNFINKGMTIEEISELANCKKRTIEKWLVEKYKLKNEFRLDNVELNDFQKKLIIGSLLGDGHIDKREKYPIFIVSHAESQKDYLFWKYEVLKNLCNKAPSEIKSTTKEIRNKEFTSLKAYRLTTRSYSCLSEYQKLNKKQIINTLEDFSFAIWILDDGSKTNSLWQLCIASLTNEETEFLQIILKERFGISSKINKNIKYISFGRIDSEKIDKIILKNIPNNLDIIQYKIINNKTNKKYAFMYLIKFNNTYYTTSEFSKKANLSKNQIVLYCKQNNLSQKFNDIEEVLRIHPSEINKYKQNKEVV